MRILRAICLLLLGATGALADTAPRLGAEANPADLADPFAFSLNPALGQMTRPQVAAGFQVLNWGFLGGAADLNTGAVNYAGRQSYGGLGLGMSWLHTPIWSDRQLTAGYGHRVVAGLSLGASLGLNQRSFDRDGLDLSEGSAADPLLAGSLARTVPTLSLAAAYSLPLEGLTAGVVLENPHEPNISLDDDDSVKLSATLRAGLGWETDRVQLAAGLADDRWRTRWAGSARWYALGEHSLLGRYDTDRWALGARVAATRKIWVEYTFTQPRSDLARAASGTHGLVICLHAPGREPKPVSYRHAAVDDAPYRPRSRPTAAPVLPVSGDALPQAGAPAGPQLLAVAAVDTALIRVKRVVRRFAPEVDMAQVARLPRWRLGVLDSTWSDRVTWEPGVQPAATAAEGRLARGTYSDGYRRQVDELRAGLADTAGPGLLIAAAPDQLDRARFLAGQLGGGAEVREFVPLDDPRLQDLLLAPVGTGPIAAMDEITLRQFPRIPLRIVVLGEAREVAAWGLEIRDSRDRTVRRYGGSGLPPAVIGWDWRDQTGRLVDVDAYNYQLTWRDADGNRKSATRREILIARQTLQRTLEFGRDRAPAGSGGPPPDARPVLILDPGRIEAIDKTQDDAPPARDDVSAAGASATDPKEGMDR